MLRSYHTAQNLYREQDADGNGTLDYARDWDKLAAAGLLGDAYASNNDQYHGYHFQWYNESTFFTWSVKAMPIEYGNSGRRYFFIDHTGVILYSVQQFNLWAVGVPIGK